MKTILVTGNAGLIGSNFCDWIIKNQSDIIVVGIDDLSGGYLENINDKIIFHKRNLMNDSVEDLFEEYQFDMVFHFAAYAAEGLSPFIRQYNYENNLITTARLINMSIKYNIKRFIFTSSMAVYGNLPTPYCETDVSMPIDPYGIAKYACEQDIQVAGKQHGLDWCIIRPHNVYGKKQNIFDVYRNVIGIWMYNIRSNTPLLIHGDGSQRRAFSYIDDSLPCLWEAGTSDKALNEIINLGGIKDYSINEVYDLVMKITNNNIVPIYVESRYDIKNAWSTFEKSVEILGYDERTSLKDGIKKMWNWAKDVPMRKRFVWSKYELNKGIYSFWDGVKK